MISSNAGSGSQSQAKDGLKESSMDKLEVTIIPVDEEPYSKTITLPSSMMCKYIF